MNMKMPRGAWSRFAGKKGFVALLSSAMFLLFAGTAFAHAVVKPATVGVGAFQVFTLGVPSEKPATTIQVRLVLPDGLNFVTPNVKPGWKAEVKTSPTGKQIQDDDGNMVDEMKPTEIVWSGGQIPTGQRDEFSFQAQVPSSETTLQWKVYQTYSDGSVISWDKDANSQPKDANGKADYSQFGPYSTTKIVNDLAATITQTSAITEKSSSTNDRLALIISVVALVMAVWARMKKS